ncbi:hypothetical protein BKA82DRAFT_4356100 [Pisolithus tinctorius]|nr:hypothetical protein BKA82DRAFT_4356100 [Pisolithus tinctorius]
MAKFRLDNPEQFISLVNLLSLRNGGQLQPSKKEEEEHEDNDVCADDESTVWGGKEDEFKQRFLDRFAEIMSRDKGGEHVCCVALRESGDQRLDEDVKISLLVARNANFKNLDENFRRRLEKLLATIGTSVSGQQNGRLVLLCIQIRLDDSCILDIVAVKNELWEELLCYNQPRLDFYADSLRANLKAFKAAGSLDSIPHYNPRLPQNDDSEHKIFCDDSCIGPYSEATHDDYMKLAQKHILELDAILCTGSRATQRRLLVERTYSIRHMTSLRIFINSCPKVSIGRGLLSDILFLGRLRSCYYTLMEAALNLPGFSGLSIIFVKSPPRRTCPATLPPLTDAIKFLGQTLNPTSVKKFISEKSGVIGAERTFKQLQDNISRQHLPTHAELQLVVHIIKTMNIKTVDKEIYPYIGCSKLSCFLCAAFLESFDHDGITFRTRGSHGKIYTLWSIPDIGGLCEDMVTALHSALKKMQNLLVDEMMKPITTTPHVAESTAAVTDYNHRSSFVRRRELGFSIMDLIMNSDPVEEVETVEATETHDLPIASECHKTPELSGECANERCENEWDSYRHTFKCAIGRPLDTADYLEDFGFTKFASAYDSTKLFGLYSFLVRILEVGSRELHKWQIEGTLTENIIAKHETMTNYAPGAYYAWFRQNLHIFNSEGGPPDLIPEAKRKSFLLYAILLNGYHPYPTLKSDNMNGDLYVEFGFVTCCDLEGEQVLSQVYRRLISQCSFTEFWTAFQSNSLVALMDAKGLEPERKQVRNLEAFEFGCDVRPSVWYLRLFVNSPDNTVEEKFSLKGLYKELLQSSWVDPMDLHAACIKGQLYEFVHGHKPNLEQRFKRLMTNIYPW